jgi:hypothetical protein
VITCSKCGYQSPNDAPFCLGCGVVPRSRKIKDALLAPLAICGIFRWAAPLGLAGFGLFLIGVATNSTWTKIAAGLFVAPLAWCYFLAMFIFLPFVAIDALGQRLKSKS